MGWTTTFLKAIRVTNAANWQRRMTPTERRFVINTLRETIGRFQSAPARIADGLTTRNQAGVPAG